MIDSDRLKNSFFESCKTIVPNVGIGTTSPSGKLHLNSANDTGEQLRLSNNSDSTNWLIGKRSNSYGQANQLFFTYWNGTSFQHALDVLPNGNVGIRLTCLVG